MLFPELPKYIKWYHWFLYPFAKKFSSYDENIHLMGFQIFGKTYITKIKKIEGMV